MPKIFNYMFGNGRINRVQYIILFMFSFLPATIFMYVLYNSGIKIGLYSHEDWELVYGVLGVLILLIFFFPFIQRRGNDIGLPKIVSYIYLFFLSLMAFSDSGEIGQIIKIKHYIMPLFLVLYFLFPGNKSKNKYGETPENTWNFGKILKKMWLSKN